MDNTKILQWLNNETNWRRFTGICLSSHVIKRLREYKSRGMLPWKTILYKFIQDYKLLENDTRDDREIAIDLLALVDKDFTS